MSTVLRCLCLLLATISHVAFAQPWKPQRNVEFIVPAAPGASFDTTARTIQRVLQEKKLLEATSTVVNKPGGGGRIGLTYLNQHAGDGHYLSILTPGILSNHVQGQSNLNYSDFTPVGILFAEYLGFAVKADSPLKSAKDMADLLRKDPTALSIAVATSRGGALHTATAIAMKAAGVDIKRMKIVVFNANSESVTAALGGHVDIAVSPPFTMASHVQQGKMRVLAMSSPRRLAGQFADVPTWRELGIPAQFASWRGLMGPKGMPAAQAAYWEGLLAQLSRAEEWRQNVERNLWEVNYVAGADLTKYLESQYEELRRILGELELSKPQ